MVSACFLNGFWFPLVFNGFEAHLGASRPYIIAPFSGQLHDDVPQDSLPALLEDPEV